MFSRAGMKGIAMDKEEFLPKTENDKPTPRLVQMMLTNFDELVEVDYIHGHTRNLKHTQGKIFSPMPDASFSDIRNYTAENMIHPDDKERYLRESDPATSKERMEEARLYEGGVHSARFRFRLIGGGWRWMESVSVAGEANGVPEGLCYIFLYDVQEQMEQGGAPLDIHSGETRSELTGLLTDENFFKRAKMLLHEHPMGWCALSMDLEHFKLFNEWYGRRHGDLLLAQIGARLAREEEQTGAIAGYFGQDDFSVLMPYDMDRINTLYTDIHEQIKGYGNSVGFMPAFGIAMADDVSCAVEELCDRASLAARFSKDNFQNRIRVFEPDMYQETERDYQLLSDFQKALKEHELFLMFQPQCKITSKRVVGAESLVRWRKADGSLVAPGVFVPVLERYGFVIDLDKYVWEEVCVWIKHWMDTGHTPLPISVNVSQIDIYSLDVPAFFGDLIKKYKLPASAIKIEITESACVDSDAVVDTVRRLRKKGFLVLMDDFGSGYSSLNMLRSLNVDILKLDAHFLRMNGEDRRKGLQIMESIVNLAKTMSVPIIVEGVETQEECDFLVGIGCRYVQGYFFYRPMLVEDFEELISDPERIDTQGFRFKVREEFHTREFLDKNVFSDAMLNNILGPVAFFQVRRKNVNITRYNQQFAEEIRSPDLNAHLTSVQKNVVKEDVPRFFTMFTRAEKDPLNGAVGVIRYNRSDGVTLQLQIQFFYLDEDETGKRFYGSVHDITQMQTINSQMRLLSHLSPDSVAFLHCENGKWFSQVVIHGLENVIGFSRDQLENELNDNSILKRVAAKDRKWLKKLIDESNMRIEGFSQPFGFKCADGKTVKLCIGMDGVEEKNCGVDSMLIIRRYHEE